MLCFLVLSPCTACDGPPPRQPSEPRPLDLRGTKGSQGRGFEHRST